jgi:S1-C subfamily serine protease
MLTLLLTSILSVLPGADKYGIAVLSQRSGSVKASAVLIHKQAALTAAHATDDTGSLTTLRCPNGIVHGLVTRRSVLLDLAIVEFEENCEAPVAELADRNPPVGAALTVVGYPGGAFLTVTNGVVSVYEIIKSAATQRYAMISDAQIFMGNSGGPVFTDNGELVGIVTGRICFNDEDQPSACWSSSVPSSLISLFLQATI